MGPCPPTPALSPRPAALTEHSPRRSRHHVLAKVQLADVLAHVGPADARVALNVHVVPQRQQHLRGGGGRHTGGVSAAIAGGGGGWGGVLPSGSGRQVLWWAPGSRPGSPSPVRDHRHHHQKRRKKIRRRQNNALVQMKLNSIQHGSSKAPAGASLRYKSNVFFPSSRTDLDVQTLQHRHAEGGRLSCSRLRPERSHNVTLLLDNFLGSLKLGGWG